MSGAKSRTSDEHSLTQKSIYPGMIAMSNSCCVGKSRSQPGKKVAVKNRRVDSCGWMNAQSVVQNDCAISSL
jgi:hypothetical protein